MSGNKKKYFAVILILILVFIGLRLALPSLILYDLNKKAADTSPFLSFQVESAAVNLINGEIHFFHITGKLGPEGKVFARADSLHVTIPWSDLFGKDRNMLLLFEGMKLHGTKEFADALTKDGERLKARRRAGHRPILSISKLEWKNSEISLPGHPKLLTNFNAYLLNLNPNEKRPYSEFKVSSKILESSPFKVEGTIRLRDEPLWWNIDLELKNFNLVALREELRQKNGMVIKAGFVDVFAEVRSKHGKTYGYFKPFLKDLQIKIPHTERNILLRTVLNNSEEKIIASRVEFSFEKSLDVKIMDALKTAIEGKVKPGIEGKLNFL